MICQLVRCPCHTARSFHRRMGHDMSGRQLGCVRSTPSHTTIMLQSRRREFWPNAHQPCNWEMKHAVFIHRTRQQSQTWFPSPGRSRLFCIICSLQYTYIAATKQNHILHSRLSTHRFYDLPMLMAETEINRRPSDRSWCCNQAILIGYNTRCGLTAP